MSSNLVQLALIGDAEVPVRASKPNRFSGANQPMKFHLEVPCQGINCSNLVPGGYAPASQKRFFCSASCRNYFDRVQYKTRKRSGTVRKIEPRQYRPEGLCEGPGCSNIVPAGMVNSHQKHYFCRDECRDEYFRKHNRDRRKLHATSPAKTRVRHILQPEGPCEGLGCTNVVPARMVMGQQKRRFCSDECESHFMAHKYVIGECDECGGPINGQLNKAGKQKFCCQEHEDQFQAKRTLGQTGPFRDLIEDYLATTTDYSDGTLPSVKLSLWHFFAFAVKEGISDLNEIKPSTIRRFIAAERARGVGWGNAVGHLSTLFRILESEDKIKRNPVIPRIHSQSQHGNRQPYSEREMAALSEYVERVNNPVLLLAFAIGEECGLRIGEVCNIRLSDVDVEAQTIFVRLPTKNGETRTVPFHKKVKKYLGLWLAQRDPSCEHDHLLHHSTLGFFKTGLLDAWFRRSFSGGPEPAASFEFHRLRHTWATRLVNNDMELAVLQVLGGWKCLSSVQCYAKIRRETVQRQYESSYVKLQEQQRCDSEEVLSLLVFADIEEAEVANPCSTAV